MRKRSPSVLCVGIILLVKVLNRNKNGPSRERRDSARLHLVDLSSGLQTAHLLCRFWSYEASTRVSAESLKSTCLRLLGWLSGTQSPCQCRKEGSDLRPGKIPHGAEQPSPGTTTTEACAPWRLPRSTTGEASAVRSARTRYRVGLLAASKKDRARQ